MAIGDTIDRIHYTDVELLASATAANGPPTAATDGLSINALRVYGPIPNQLGLKIYSTAGSDAMTLDGKMWGYSTTGTVWLPMGVGSGGVGAGSKGSVNGGVQIAETIADTISHAEVVQFFEFFDRLYFEIVAIGGTDTAVTVQLIVPRID